MGVSIALCTYNGERFLDPQLASIAALDRPPDELVVHDDCSSDRTVEIVRAFAASAPFPVRLTVNDETLGSTRNFSAAINDCREEMILLSDQDDVWLPHKVGVLERELSQSNNVGFVFSDATLVDDSTQPLGETLWQAIRFSHAERQRMQSGSAFDVLVRRNTVTGATLGFRSLHKDLVLPIPSGWVHDGWIALLISTVAGCRCINEPLLQYRQHSGQQLGERKRNLYEQYCVAKSMKQDDFRKMGMAYALAARRLEQFGGSLVESDAVDRLREKVQHWETRATMRAHGEHRLPSIWREIRSGHYRRYSLGWKCIAQDLFL